MTADSAPEQVVPTTTPPANTARAREILTRLVTTDSGLELDTQLTLNEALIELNAAVDWPYPPVNQHRVPIPATTQQALDLIEQARVHLAAEATDSTAAAPQALAAAIAARRLGTVLTPDPEPEAE